METNCYTDGNPMPEDLEIQSDGYDLTPAQLNCIEKFKDLKIGALFMKMGTGKTRAAVELVNMTDADFLLYLTPYNTRDNVTRELKKWRLRAPFRVVGYESIAASDRIYMECRAEVEKHAHAFVIADESIFIKHGRTKRHKRSCALRSLCEYALVLNGTPIVKDEWDLYNQMSFLSPKIIPYGCYDFIAKFFVEHAIKRNGRERHYYTFYEPNRPALTKLIAPYVFQADLEFTHEEKDQCKWISIDTEEYDTTRDDILDACELEDDSVFIQLFGALNHAAALAPEKNAAVAEYIAGRQVICFCNYLEEVEQIRKLCDCYVITGETRTKDRDRIILEFERNTKPLIMTMGCGSYSLNLQFCNEIVYSSLTFNYGQFEQSKYRIKRTGQERNIQYTYILSNVGINSMIFRNLDRKEGLAGIIKTLLRENEDEPEEKRKQLLKEIL